MRTKLFTLKSRVINNACASTSLQVTTGFISRLFGYPALLLPAILFSAHLAFGQMAPVKEWDRSFGGSKNDDMYTILQTSDGGYLLGGDSNSPASGDKSQGSQGLNDYWVVKTDSQGNKQWDKRFGGNGIEELYVLLETPDGYLLGGYSASTISGDQTQASRGSSDYWLVKIDFSGNKIWDKRYGGPSDDEFRAMAPTADGGFILAGESKSGIGGEKSKSNIGEFDVWVVKIDSDGNKQWDNSYGGLLDDRVNAIQQTPDGGYIIGAWTVSPIGYDVSEVGRGSSDMWLIRTDASGVKMWDARYGGNDNEYLYGLDQTNDGGYILGGYTRSNVNGEVTIPGKGGFDFWMVKTDGNGVKLWDKRYGGLLDEKGKSIFQTNDGGYVMGGWSESDVSGDKTQNSKGGTDYWVIGTDASGNKLWDLDLGGNNVERLHDVPQTSDGGFIVAGHSYSGKNGDKTQPSNGIDDYWIVKLASITPAQTYYRDLDGDGYGNAAADTLAATVPAGYVSNSADCNDNNATINPGAAEVCNTIDDNCNGLADDADPTVTGQGIFYTDNDSDGYGAGMEILACLQPAGTVSLTGDCNDTLATINPGAAEVCNTIDDNCNGLADDADPTVTGQGIFYTDIDSDSYGSLTAILACVQPAGTVLTTGDCNDNDAAVHPGAPDVCNGIDDNCDFVTDENPLETPIVTPSGNVTSCTGDVVTLSTGYDPAFQYQWYKTNKLQPGATGNTYSTSKSGNIYVKISTVPGCEATSAVTTLSKAGKPDATITPLGDLDICLAGFVDLQANEGTGLVYQWKKGSKLLDGATDVIYQATTKGNYRVIVTNETGCNKTSSMIAVTKSCKAGESKDDGFTSALSVYPNPAGGFAVVALSLDQQVNEEAIIVLADVTGRTVMMEKAAVANGVLRQELALAGKVPPGIYFVRVLLRDQVVVKNIVVQ